MSLDRIKRDINFTSMPKEKKDHCISLVLEYERDNENSSCLDAVEQILSIYSKRVNLPIGFSSHEQAMMYINRAWDLMEKSTYGHCKTKTHIIEHLVSRALGVRQKVLGLCGPPGTGKTTLVINGLSKALNIPFYHISLGGLKDSTFFSGSARYWKGSHSGIIAKALSQCGLICMIYLDEIDKIAPDNIVEILGYLTHALDPSSNTNVYDNYLGIGLDLSNVIFVLSFNDISSLTRPLVDRIDLVVNDDFSIRDKALILRNFLLPSILDEFGISPGIITISYDTALQIATELRYNVGLRKHISILRNIVNRVLIWSIKSVDTYEDLALKCPRLPLTVNRNLRSTKHKTLSMLDIFEGDYSLPYSIKYDDIFTL